MANEIELKLLLDGKEVKATLGNVDDLIREVRNESKSVGDNISNWGNAVTGFNQGLELARKGMNLLSKPLEVAGMFEEAKVQLSVLLGDMDLAEQRIDELSQFSANTPFEFPQIIKASKTLQTFGGDVLAVGDNLTMIGDVSAGAGQPIEELALHFGRLYDSIQSGRPAGEALMRLQEIGALTGEARAEIEKAINTNKDSAETWNIVTEAMSRYDGMMQKQSETLNGMVSNAMDQVTLLLAEMGDQIMPIAKDILDVLIPAIGGVTENLDTIIPVLKVIAVSTAAFAVAVYGAEAALKAKAIAVQLADRAMKIFNTTMNLNPIAAVAASIITLTTVIYELTDGLNITTSSLGDFIDEQQREISTRKELNDKLIEQLENQKQEAIKNGESAESVEELDGKLKELLKTRKELNQLEKEIAAQATAKEYIDNLYSAWETFLAGPIQNNDVFINEAIVATQLLSGTIQERINNVNKFLETASGDQKVLLLKLKTDLIDMQLTEENATESTVDGNIKKKKTVNDLKEEVKSLKASLGELTPEQVAEAQRIKQQIEAKQQLIDRIEKEIDTKKTLSDQEKEAAKVEEKKTSITQSIERKQIVESFKLEVTGITEAEEIRNRLAEEEQRFNDILESLSDARTEDKVDEIKSDLDLSAQKIEILENQNEKIKASDQRLMEAKENFFADYEQQISEEQLAAEIRVMTHEEMNNAIVAAEQEKYDLIAQMRNAETEAELQDLQQKIQTAAQKEELLKREADAIKKSTEQQILALARQYDAHKSFLQNFLNMTRQLIKAEIAKTVAQVVGDALISVPFPFNIALGAAAAVAVNSLFDEIIPEFEAGYVDINGKLHRDGGETVKVEGGESIINRTGTARNKELLKLINEGKQFNIVGNNAVNLDRFYSSSPVNNSVSNISQIAVSFDRAMNYQTRVLEKKLDKVIEASGVKISMSDFDEGYQNYLKSIGYMQ